MPSPAEAQGYSLDLITKDQAAKEAARKELSTPTKEGKKLIDSPEGQKELAMKWIDKAKLSKAGKAAVMAEIGISEDMKAGDFVKKVAEWQGKNGLAKPKEKLGDGVLGWKTLEEVDKKISKGQTDNDDIDTDYDNIKLRGLARAEGIARVEGEKAEQTKRADKLKELKDDAESIDSARNTSSSTKVDPEGNALRYNSVLKAWVGDDNQNKDKILDTTTGDYSEKTEEQMLAENKTKSENEKKTEDLISTIQSAAAEGDGQEYIQGYLDEIPKDGLSEKQLADLNSSLKDKGLKIAPYSDAEHYGAGNQSNYFVEETGFGAEKDYKDRFTLGNNPEKYLGWSVEGKTDKKTGLLKDKTLSELKPELVNGKNNTSMPEEVKKEILALVDIAKNKPELQNITFQKYLETIKDPFKAALALAPRDKPEVLPGKLGEWGVKYQKNAEGLTIALHEGEKVPKIVTDKGEVNIREHFTKTGNYTLPNGQEVRVAMDGTTKKWEIAEKPGDELTKWVLDRDGKLEEIKKPA